MKEKQDEIDTHHEHMQLSSKVVIEISLKYIYIVHYVFYLDWIIYAW